MKYILFFLIFFLEDYILFGLMARRCGKACNYDCNICENWACTHLNGGKSCYPCCDWSKWCNK